MNNIPVTSASLPSGNIDGTSPTNNATGIDKNPTSAAFANLLAHKMGKPVPPTSLSGNEDRSIAASFPAQDKTAATTDALSSILAQIPIEMRSTSPDVTSTETDTPAIDYPALSPQELASIPVNTPNAVLPHIPVETRSTTVIDHATLLASGSRADTAIDVPSHNSATASTVSETPLSLAIPAQNTPIHLLPATDTKTSTDTTAELLAAPESLLLRQDATTSLPQMNAAPISQATISAMSGLPAGNPAAATTLTIATPMGNPAWAEDFTQKINWQLSQKIQIAELHLNPANLGPLDVVLKISDNQATALFTSPHASVREAVENALPKLREMLSDNGIMLSNASVGDQAPKQRNMEEFAGRKSGASSVRSSTNAATEASAVSPTLSTRRHNGMIDTFA